MNPPLYRIDNNAMLVFFLRTKVGKEFEVADKIRSRFASIQSQPIYFTCFGRYDLLELVMVNSHTLRHRVPINEDIIETSSSLFYSWQGISKPVDKWAVGSPLLVAVFLNVHPILIENPRFEAETQIIHLLQQRFGEDANIFLGMGHSEILLLFKGRNCDDLLRKVTDQIRKLKFGDIDIPPESFRGCPSETAIFICTTSYPVLAHPTLRGDQSYEKLEGYIVPEILIDCAPGLEDYIVEKSPQHSRVRNVYGKYDLVIEWVEPVKTSTFAKELTDFRNSIVGKIGINSTCTMFKSLNTGLPEKAPHTTFWGMTFPISSSYLAKEFSELSARLDPVERGQLLDFLGRFDAYYYRPESQSFFGDMVGLKHTVLTVLEQIQGANPEDRQLWQTYLSQVMDLANHAVYQRYAGIETHFEFDQHVPFPFLCDINGYTSAANSIPLFLFKSFFPEGTLNDSWPGFILFGQSYSYQWLPGHILSFQAGALFRPIQDWWGITHEIAHSIYWLTEFLETIEDPEISDYITKMGNITEQDFLIDIAEIFANWFDYKYFFAGNAQLYFPIIWRSWLRWERVWAHAPQYLLRSLATFWSGYLGESYNAQYTSGPITAEFMENKFDQMNRLILGAVPDYARFIETIRPDQKKKYPYCN